MIQYEEYYPKRYQSNFPESMLEEWRTNIEALSNAELLDDYTDLSAGDDWEGGRTPGGDRVWHMLKIELEKRLRACYFLDGDVE